MSTLMEEPLVLTAAGAGGATLQGTAEPDRSGFSAVPVGDTGTYVVVKNRVVELTAGNEDYVGEARLQLLAEPDDGSGTTHSAELYAQVYSAGAPTRVRLHAETDTATIESDVLGFYRTSGAPQATTSIGSAAVVAGDDDPVQIDTTFDGYTVGQIVTALRAVGLLQ